MKSRHQRALRKAPPYYRLDAREDEGIERNAHQTQKEKVMFNRTMSYLFLTVVAAAVFLVSGCAPIESKPTVPTVTKVDVEENLRNLSTAILEAVRTDTDLQHNIIQSLCDNSLRIIVRNVDKEFGESLVKVMGTKPMSSTDSRGKKGLFDYIFYYKDISKERFNKIKHQVDTLAAGRNPQVVLAQSGKGWQGCAPLKAVTGHYAYASTFGQATPDKKDTYNLSIEVQLDAFPRSTVWLHLQDNHWLEDLQKKQKGFVVPPELTGKSISVGTDGKATVERRYRNLGVNPDLFLSDTNQKVYVMVATEIPNIPDIGTLRVVQYRVFNLTSTTKGRVPEVQLPLKNPTSQPACPPTEHMQGKAWGVFQAELNGWLPSGEECK